MDIRSALILIIVILGFVGVAYIFSMMNQSFSWILIGVTGICALIYLLMQTGVI